MKNDKIGIYIRTGSSSLTNDEEFKEKANRLIKLFCKDAIDRKLLDEKMAELKAEYGK